MEEYKDVMLSEPPSRYTAAPTMQSMSLENYKGILLCDRPAEMKAKGKSDVIPFLPAGKGYDENYLGLQPSVEHRSKFELSRSVRQTTKVKHLTAISKHKRWLSSFASAVKQMQLDKVEETLTKEAQNEKLRERQMKQIEERKQQVGQTEEDYPEAPTEQRPSSTNEANEGKGKKSKSSNKAAKEKPRWAMTEEEAENADDDDIQNLLSFAESLDYEQFINDYEVKEALAIMRDRVKEIAVEQGIDLTSTVKQTEQRPPEIRGGEQSGGDAEASATRDGRAFNPKDKWNSSTVLSDRLRNAVNQEALLLAEKLLANSESLKRIHSKASLARLLQDATINTGEGATATGISQVPMLPGLVPPTMSIVSAEAMGTEPHKPQKRILVELKKSKYKVQNLPYMYQCPSI